MYLSIFVLSIWQSILFWDKNPGIAVILFILPFIVFLLYYMYKNNKIKNKMAITILIPIVLLSATYFVFNNEFLRSVNDLAIPVLIIIMIIELICDKFTLENIIGNIFGFAFKPIEYIGQVGKKIVKMIKKDENTKIDRPQNIKRIIKAILFSIPLLLVVFILLVTADSEFSKLFVNVLEHVFNLTDKIIISNMVTRIIIIVIMFFYLAGFMENIFLTNDIVRKNKDINQKDNLTIKFLLTFLNIMYLVFCIIQVKSLFNIYTMNKNNINYSYYARQGFFQLMVVSAINLIMILKSKKSCYNQEKYINIMDLLMIFLTTIILISSFIRMYLYQESYGFTLKRVLVFWAQFTEGILLVPTIMYVLNKKINLARTYFITITTMYVILNFANINSIIAKKNVNLYLNNKSVGSSDINYLISLGTDAVEETIKLSAIVKNEDNNSNYWDMYDNGLKSGLHEMNDELNDNYNSWQEYNISKSRAKKILEDKLY